VHTFCSYGYKLKHNILPIKIGQVGQKKVLTTTTREPDGVKSQGCPKHAVMNSLPYQCHEFLATLGYIHENILFHECLQTHDISKISISR